MSSYDYSGAGTYFITICVNNRACLLGSAGGGAMVHSRLGEIARDAWVVIPAHFPSVELDEFVVMPNHLHGIIRMRANTTRAARKDDFSRPAQGSLAALIRAYKSFTTRTINTLQNTKGALFWQRNYYERIIRDDNELMQTRSYIRLNPKRWVDDEYHQG